MNNQLSTQLHIQLIKESPIPLYKQILNVLRDRIASGECAAGTKLPSETELGNELNVSRVTIRQAFSAAVEEGLVVRVAGKGTFVTKESAAPMNKGFVGYVVHHLSSSFNVQTLLGVETVLKAQGYNLIFCNSESDLEKENELLHRLHANEMAGYIIWPVHACAEDRVINQLIARSVPVVLIDRQLPGVAGDLVESDHYMGGRMVVQHLVSQGYEDIVYLAHNPITLSSVSERIQGYRDAMLDAGLQAQEPVVVGGIVELGYIQDRSTVTLYETTAVDTIAAFLCGPNRPQAIVAMNDLVALLVIESAQKAGLNIPGDLALVGFDDLDFAARQNLTSVRQQPHLIGVESAQILLSRIRGEHGAPKHVRLPVQLMVRGSSIKPA